MTQQFSKTAPSAPLCGVLHQEIKQSNPHPLPPHPLRKNWKISRGGINVFLPRFQFPFWFLHGGRVTCKSLARIGVTYKKICFANRILKTKIAETAEQPFLENFGKIY